jgi:hypothetical protein
MLMVRRGTKQVRIQINKGKIKMKILWLVFYIPKRNQGNSTKGSVHRDARERYDVMGCEYQRIDWQLLPALCSDWPSDVTEC